MSGIIVTLKPESVSWEELSLCQQKAHESNHASGFDMQCATFTGEQLHEAVKNGITLVALSEKDDLMGMLSVTYNKVNRWWHRGIAAYICYVAVHPGYKGKGVYRALADKALEEIQKEGVNVEYLNTHVRNKAARRAYEKDDYRCVRFSPGSGTDYYSVEMAKWIDGHGKSRWLCKLMFSATELLVRILYKPGKVRRF